jgi:hypothetical protein
MTSQTDQRPVQKATLPEALFRHWTHSREEDADGVEIYRPDGFDFPPGHGRDGFAMRPDGRFISEEPAADDGTVTVPGHWRRLGPLRVGVTLVDDSPRFAFDIVAVDDAVLRIRRVPVEQDLTEPALLALPPASTARLIDFADARVRRDELGALTLEVSGQLPVATMVVRLSPLVYVQQPVYWEIEVVGTLPGGAPSTTKRYTASLPLAGSIGTRGIDVRGASTFARFDLVDGSAA